MVEWYPLLAIFPKHIRHKKVDQTARPLPRTAWLTASPVEQAMRGKIRLKGTRRGGWIPDDVSIYSPAPGTGDFRSSASRGRAFLRSNTGKPSLPKTLISLLMILRTLARSARLLKTVNIWMFSVLRNASMSKARKVQYTPTLPSDRDPWDGPNLRYYYYALLNL